MPSPNAEFLQTLLSHGRVLLRAQADAPLTDDPEARELLEAAFDGYRPAVAGPPVRFQPATAAAAAELLRTACRLLLDRRSAAELPAIPPTGPDAVRTAGHHLSADLLLRYLPAVRRRALAVSPNDPLAARLTDVLRTWPLSGVLAELDDPPAAPPDFPDHAGAAMLYAERWRVRSIPAWAPVGLAAEYAGMIAIRRAPPRGGVR
jgi:hypothetical protein